MSYTNAQLLEKVETAIAAILDGAQSITIRNRTFTRGDLKTLIGMRKDLKIEVSLGELGSKGSRTVCEF